MKHLLDDRNVDGGGSGGPVNGLARWSRHIVLG
jgi:hypothetical protein